MAGQVISSNLTGELDKVAHYPDALRQNKEICGINVYGKEIKLSQYADDTILILEGFR